MRKIIPISSKSTSDSTFLPIGSRLVSVKGEADGKPTYDFVVGFSQFTSGGTSKKISVKYCGMKNGTPVNLWKEWPQMATTSSTPTALGHQYYEIQAGSGVVLQIYYCMDEVAT